MANKIIGTSGNDQLLGTSGENDVMKGLDGNDYLYGRGGADRLIGGKGDDIVDGADGDLLADTLLGGGGDDRINGGAGDRLDGGAGSDFFGLYLQGATSAFKLDLTGLTKGGTLHLKDGTTVIGMESGQMTLGSGADKISIGNAKVAVYAGGGDDSLTGGAGGDTLGAGAGDDLINGGKGSDWVSYQGVSGAVHVDLTIQGEAQDTGEFGGMDTLISIENLQGSANDDVLTGDGHANRIDSWNGADTLTGGGGADTFVFNFAGQSQAFSPVTITDLGDDDTIDVHGIDADRTTDGNQDFTVVAHFNGHAGQLIVFKNGDDTVIQMDTNGDGSADEGIVVLGDHADFTNFVL
jgi:Ca2+-binding RTX toxin-like protein